MSAALTTTAAILPDLANVQEPAYRMQAEKFYFRKSKAKTIEGVDVEEAKRPSVSLELPIPTIHGIAYGLSQNAKVQEYIAELVKNAVVEAAKAQVSDSTKPVNAQEELDLSKLSLDFLANEPRTDRRGRGIPTELWEAFAADYINIMPSLLNKSVDKVTSAAQLFLKKLATIKTNKPVLNVLDTYLDTYTANTEQADDFGDIIEYLKEKLATFLNARDEDYLSAIA